MKFYKVDVGTRGTTFDRTKLASYGPWIPDYTVVFGENELTDPGNSRANILSEYSFTRGSTEYIVPRACVALIR